MEHLGCTLYMFSLLYIYRHVKLIHTTVADSVRVLRRGFCLASFAIDWTEIKPFRNSNRREVDGWEQAWWLEWNSSWIYSKPPWFFVCFSTQLFFLDEVKREQTVWNMFPPINLCWFVTRVPDSFQWFCSMKLGSLASWAKSAVPPGNFETSYARP